MVLPPTKIAPKFETEVEAAKFWLEQDTTDYGDWGDVVRPNLRRADHVVPISIPDAEYSPLSSLAAAGKKSLVEMIGKILEQGLKELRTKPAARV